MAAAWPAPARPHSRSSPAGREETLTPVPSPAGFKGGQKTCAPASFCLIGTAQAWGCVPPLHLRWRGGQGVRASKASPSHGTPYRSYVLSAPEPSGRGDGGEGLRSPSGSGAGVRARRSWPRRRHAGHTSVRRAIGAAPATALRSAPAASCALRQR